MGLDNPIHIAFLLILLLLVFGAKRLPEMGKSLGSGMRGFKDALSGEEHSALVAHQQPAAVAPAAVAGVAAVPLAAAPPAAAPPAADAAPAAVLEKLPA
jgi:sec-independent protein translocase protein TatA